MMYSTEHEYVYVRIPKTGTTSVGSWLKKRYSGKDYGRHHEWKVPDAFKSYLIFATVRNPYARCFSLWHFDSMRDESEMSFAEYLESLIEKKKHGDPASAANEMYLTQSQYVEMAGVQFVVKLESLKDELRMLPFVRSGTMIIPWLKKGVKACAPFERYYNAKQESLLWQYCKEDFINLGYERINA